MTTVDSAALAKAYADGVECGLQLAIDRMTAFMSCVSGIEDAGYDLIISGQYTAEMYVEWRSSKQRGARAPDHPSGNVVPLVRGQAPGAAPMGSA
jgi:hypothetical protein